MTEAELQQAIENGQVQNAPTPEVQPSEPPQPQSQTQTIDEFLIPLNEIRHPKKNIAAAPMVVPKTMPEQFEFYDDGSSKRMYFNINNIWYYVDVTAPNTFRDWRYPDNPQNSSNSLIAKTVDNTTGYTVPNGKRLYIYSVRFDTAGTLFQVDGKTILSPDLAEAWQGRTGVAGLTGFFINPLIVEAGSVLKTDKAPGVTTELIGFLVDTPVANITVKIQSVSSGSGYTVPSGKMFVLLNAWTDDTVSLRITPSGLSVHGAGKNINRTGNSGGWMLGQPWFCYPGDKIDSDNASTSEATINGYEITL